MFAQSEKSDALTNRQKRWNRFWRYAPLVAWMLFIFSASTSLLSGNNTSRFVRPFLLWLFPHISEDRIYLVHFTTRKIAHFTEYAIFGFLAARAFYGSTHDWLRRRWFTFAAALIILYSLSDEFHQSFVPSRGASIYDSMIDTAGGLTALLLFAFWQRRKRDRVAV
ncbi:MAG: VanZ family protein [Pyrinomonadaceae bacterium]